MESRFRGADVNQVNRLEYLQSSRQQGFPQRRGDQSLSNVRRSGLTESAAEASPSETSSAKASSAKPPTTQAAAKTATPARTTTAHLSSDRRCQSVNGQGLRRRSQVRRTGASRSADSGRRDATGACRSAEIAGSDSRRVTAGGREGLRLRLILGQDRDESDQDETGEGRCDSGARSTHRIAPF